MVVILILCFAVPTFRSFIGRAMVGRSTQDVDARVRAPVSLEDTPHAGMVERMELVQSLLRDEERAIELSSGSKTVPLEQIVESYQTPDRGEQEGVGNNGMAKPSSPVGRSQKRPTVDKVGPSEPPEIIPRPSDHLQEVSDWLSRMCNITICLIFWVSGGEVVYPRSERRAESDVESDP